MTLQTVTRIAGFNLTGQSALDTVRVSRAAMGLHITGLGLVVFATEGVPLVWAAIQHILATPAQLQAVKLSAIAGAATGLAGGGLFAGLGAVAVNFAQSKQASCDFLLVLKRGLRMITPLIRFSNLFRQQVGANA